jgi:hypothetical protein
MTGGIIQRLRAAGLVLALAAITFKAFLPPGFMFAELEGRAALVICTIMGAADHDGSNAPGSVAGEHCPFAAASVAAITPTPELLSAPVAANGIVLGDVAIAQREHAPPTGPPLPARGPPLQA